MIVPRWLQNYPRVLFSTLGIRSRSYLSAELRCTEEPPGPESAVGLRSRYLSSAAAAVAVADAVVIRFQSDALSRGSMSK